MNNNVEPLPAGSLRVSHAKAEAYRDMGMRIVQPTLVAQAVHYALYGKPLQVLIVPAAAEDKPTKG